MRTAARLDRLYVLVGGKQDVLNVMAEMKKRPDTVEVCVNRGSVGVVAGNAGRLGTNRNELLGLSAMNTWLSCASLAK